MEVFVNGKSQAVFEDVQLPSRDSGVPLFPAISVCHQSPTEAYTLIRSSIFSDWSEYHSLPKLG